MRVDVMMPQMGESIAEGTITRWLKKVGDSVQRDEPLFEISTDKVDAEIPSPAEGTLLEILVHEGETVVAAHDRQLGIRRLGASGRHLYWEGKRYVLRGVAGGSAGPVEARMTDCPASDDMKSTKSAASGCV